MFSLSPLKKPTFDLRFSLRIFSHYCSLETTRFISLSHNLLMLSSIEELHSGSGFLSLLVCTFFHQDSRLSLYSAFILSFLTLVAVFYILPAKHLFFQVLSFPGFYFMLFLRLFCISHSSFCLSLHTCLPPTSSSFFIHPTEGLHTLLLNLHFPGSQIAPGISAVPMAHKVLSTLDLSLIHICIITYVFLILWDNLFRVEMNAGTGQCHGKGSLLKNSINRL